jgi:hypothetical protein
MACSEDSETSRSDTRSDGLALDFEALDIEEEEDAVDIS